MSTIFGDPSMFLTLRHPDMPGETVVFQYTRNKRIRIVRLKGTEKNAETWASDPNTVGDSIHGQKLMTGPEAKVVLADLEAQGWVDAKDRTSSILGTVPTAPGVSGAQMDAINQMPVITREELLTDE